jgi:PKD repeat protein
VTINERSTVPINLQLNSVSSGIATFTANLSGASPISGSIRVYDWDFGDGKSASTSGNQTSNRYSSPGNYLVRVRVLTTTGQEGFAELPVRIPVF